MNLALGLFAAALLVMFLPGLEQPANAPRVALILIAAPLLWTLLSWRRSSAPSRVVGLLAVVVLGAGALGLMLVPAAERVAVSFDLVVLAALLGLALSGSRLDEEQVAAVACGAAWGLAVIAPLGLMQAWLGWEMSWLSQARPPAATFVNRNVAAEAMVVAVPLAFWTGLRARRTWTRWGAISSAAAGAAFLIATRSRGGWGAAAIGWGLMLAAAWWSLRHASRARADQRRGKERVTSRPAAPATSFVAPFAAPLVAAALLIVAALLIPVRGIQPLPSVASTLSLATRPMEGSGSTRLALARNTLAMIGERPLFGVGAGRWSTVYPLYHQRAAIDPQFSLERQPERCENDWLERAAELGAPATVALALLFVGGVWYAVRQQRWALAASLAGVSLHALIAFPLHSPASAGLAMLIVGAAWRASSPTAPVDAAPVRAWSLRIVAIVLTIVAAGLAYRVVAGQRQVTLAVSSNDCATRTSAARRVAQLTPWARRDIGLTAAAVFQCERDPATSLALIEPALAINPYNLNLLLLAAARQLRADAPERAEGLARRALEVRPQLGRAWLLLAMAQDARGDATSAGASCENALRWYDTGPEAHTYCDNRVQ